MSARPTVLVTGLGATTPLGGDVASTWSALLAGKSGVRALADGWPEDLPVRIGAAVAVDPKDVLERVRARTLDRSQQLALIAAQEAWADAGPVIKRVMPMAMGGRGIIKRKTCHVTIKVSDQPPAKKK